MLPELKHADSSFAIILLKTQYCIFTKYVKNSYDLGKNSVYFGGGEGAGTIQMLVSA